MYLFVRCSGRLCVYIILLIFLFSKLFNHQKGITSLITKISLARTLGFIWSSALRISFAFTFPFSLSLSLSLSLSIYSSWSCTQKAKENNLMIYPFILGNIWQEEYVFCCCFKGKVLINTLFLESLAIGHPTVISAPTLIS